MAVYYPKWLRNQEKEKQAIEEQLEKANIKIKQQEKKIETLSSTIKKLKKILIY